MVDLLSLSGSPSYILARKLKALKTDLRAWNEVFGNIEKKKQLLLDDLQVLEVWRKTKA